MVGHIPLKDGIGVRVPAPQQQVVKICTKRPLFQSVIHYSDYQKSFIIFGVYSI